jgi:hypothetical protein
MGCLAIGLIVFGTFLLAWLTRREIGGWGNQLTSRIRRDGENRLD